ncbi:D-aminoacyl-tRNA deacylase [Alicyclobacillus sp.]|uniref:D-aminoacyl-tRNA deacylase n=1 Tax=Alicyclobacillus sp. TaxID=61169 RepID=UPI0025BD96DC|nr:D-aminoacyl-tRNA deacylase [Alicyclobacillus sp.]MCL6516523.1 D-tyrosyl-tRNA(Tyr) deacylase [Alicyclobacillus sp.]
MRAVVQRSGPASVRVDGEVVGRVPFGLVVLLGVRTGDTAEDARYLADKVAHLRVFPDETGKMNRDVREAGGAVLSISQFTLYGDVRKGRRPNYMEAARPEEAEALYEQFNAHLREYGLRVETGRFGAMMEVSLVNDGPVTILLDSQRLF